MDVLIRSAAMFVVVWLALRVAGKRDIAQMDAFDLVVVIVLGDLVAQGVLQEDYSFVGAITVLGVFVLASVSFSYLAWRFPRARSLLEGEPTILVRGGVADERAMRAERVTITDLEAAARGQGHAGIDEADLVVLETDGSFSFFERRS